MTAKRIILMYISEVSGHHSATLAIEKAIRILEPNTEILNINAFNYTNPISEKVINKIYLGVIKATPQIWDYLYDNPSIVKNLSKIKESIHKFNSPKLRNLFDKFKPDTIVCTQAFPCGMVADYKRAHGLESNLIAVLTDYVPHSFWIYDKVDFYISPCEEVTLRLIEKGVSANKIKTFGIPIDPRFNQDIIKDEVLEKLNLKPNVATILIMGGGQGLGPIKTIIRSLEKVSLETQEIIVTGTNKRLYKYLKRKIKKYKKKIVVFGYANNINELMSVSDIIITKPGGITTAEAMTKRIPMIIVKPIPGQELKNTAYLTKKGAAIKIDKPKDSNSIIENLLRDPNRLNCMRQIATVISKPNASLDIAKLFLGYR